MIEPLSAVVRPRVLIPGAEGAALLEDAVADRLEACERGFVEITGAAGCGKSTALAHLAEVFAADPRLELADGPDAEMILWLASDTADYRLVVCASPERAPHRRTAEKWRLKPWTSDDWIEYLLAVHGERCASVMRCVLADLDRLLPGGNPRLWRVILDRMAADEAVTEIKGALRSELYDRLSSTLAREIARGWCFAALKDPGGTVRVDDALQSVDVDPETRALLVHPLPQLPLAAEHLAGHLTLQKVPRLLAKVLPASLVRETAGLVGNSAVVRTRLRNILTGKARGFQAMAASLLRAADLDCIPAEESATCLTAAHLAGVCWHGVPLRQVDLVGADLTGADLSEARLQTVLAHNALLSGANLHGAELNDLLATRAVLTYADLSFVRAPGADFHLADLSGANLEGALLRYAIFMGADLRGARFCRADLSSARLHGAKLEGADFTGANLFFADFKGLSLRGANFSGAQFTAAWLDDCDLEFVRLPGADFHSAHLKNALLTGSQMPGARFYRAELRGARMADIEWEGADLREADLRDCTFHQGSSRSGLVGSPIASEGSRTGFYTDEFHEQDFKAPEEIRKADLRNADLRGARIDNVDFYLVDLRGAKYSDDQEDHFRRCGAILETRV